MKAALPGLLVLAALLIVPFALRPATIVERDAPRRLVILTPHNEAIRYEMSRGFALYRARQRAPAVHVDWRSPGGTTELSRYLISEYRSVFENYFEETTGSPLSERGAQAFANPKQSPLGDDEAARARRAFLGSNVSVKIDLLFGGGSYDFSQHAEAGRLVDSGIAARRPELFGEHGIPQQVGGEPYWDKQGRWIGACVSGFGICYNRQALARLGITTAPTRWADLADPRLAGHVALADPSKSGSANKAFEMLIQQRMGEMLARRGSPARGSAAESAALAEGFDDGLRLVRRIGSGARYFTDQAGKVVQDVQNGSAAAGMCIDFYGRFDNDQPGPGARLHFVQPEGGSSMGADPIGLLRGAPNPEEAKSFMDFVLDEAGQSLWAYRRGVPGGPERYALRRAPILPQMFEPWRRPLRSDPEDDPYLAARSFTYHPSWTAPLFRALSFVIRVMCVDTEVELHEAAEALAEHGYPPEAQRAFDDMSLVSYGIVKREIAPALGSGDPLREVALQNQLVKAMKAHYERVTELARQRR
jgi:iron(III) transport system substrate-binding protein